MLVSVKDRKEWHDIRHPRVGGSEIGAIMGVNPNMSPLGVYERKVAPVVYEEAGELPLFIGNVEEDSAAKWFEHETGLKTRKPGGSYIEGDYFVANPDRLIEGRKEILECKTAGAFSPVLDYYHQNQIPPTHLLQINWYLGIMKYEKAYICCLAGGNVDAFILEHNFDGDLFEQEKLFAKVFMEEYVNKQIPPKATVKDMGELARIYGKSVESVDISQFSDKLYRYQEIEASLKNLRAQTKPLEEEQKEIKTELLDFLKGRQGISEDFIIKNTYVNTPSVDTKKLMADHPEMYEEYKKPTEYYRITIKENK